MNTRGQELDSHNDVVALKERIEIAEKRIAELELNRIQDLQLIRDYIKGSESLSNQIQEDLRTMPDKLTEILKAYKYPDDAGRR